MRIDSRKTSLSSIQLDPLSPQQKEELFEQVFEGFADKIDSDKLLEIFSKLRSTLENYIKEYYEAWNKFSEMTNIQKFKEDLKAASGKGYYSEKKVTDMFNAQEIKDGKIVEKFLRVLEKGFLILERLRELLTEQTITTEFTLKNTTGSKIYRVPKSQITYKLGLSAYGASGKNFVSLAYNVQVSDTIKKLETEIKGTEVIGTNIYKTIMSAKSKYLEDKSKKTHKTYTPHFDHKDAEIFNLLSQRKLKQIKWTTYKTLRALMGGASAGSEEDERKGNKVTSMQAGDVGLIQDKLIQSGVNQVNFGRQTLIIGHIEKLYRALLDLESNKNNSSIKETLLELFTVQNKSAIHDAITEEANNAAIKVIESIFKNF